MAKNENTNVIDQQSKLIAELREFGLAADDAELGMEQSSAGLKTHNGTMYVTKDGKRLAQRLMWADLVGNAEQFHVDH